MARLPPVFSEGGGAWAGLATHPKREAAKEAALRPAPNKEATNSEGVGKAGEGGGGID